MTMRHITLLSMLAATSWGCDVKQPKQTQNTADLRPAADQANEPARGPENPTNEPKKLVKIEVREKGVSGGTLQLSMVGAPKSLNPIIANESVSNRIPEHRVRHLLQFRLSRTRT